MSPKYDLEIDGKIYQIYYGYKGSIEGDFEEKDEILPKVTSMSINAEKKSLEITLKNFEENQIFWVMIPFDVISAKGDNFLLLIDGVETSYDFTKKPNDNAIGMIVPKDAKHLEIIGTSVIPEFDAIMAISMTAFVPVVLFSRFQKMRN